MSNINNGTNGTNGTNDPLVDNQYTSIPVSSLRDNDGGLTFPSYHYERASYTSHTAHGDWAEDHPTRILEPNNTRPRPIRPVGNRFLREARSIDNGHFEESFGDREALQRNVDNQKIKEQAILYEQKKEKEEKELEKKIKHQKDKFKNPIFGIEI